MSQLSADQMAQRVYECGLMTTKDLESTLRLAGGREHATFDGFVSTLLEQEMLTNWQVSRLVAGHRRGYFYGNWKVLYLIGAGTFARVYRASHKNSGDIKAVKVLRQRYSNDDETREQFLQEARMVMKLRHPNIVPIYEVDEDKGRIYMVMDFVEGQNLREYVRAHKKLPLMTALNIVRDVSAGLKYAAESNITHRDMKLSNVLLSSKGQAKLVDFGLATVSSEKGDEKGGPRSIDYAGLEKTTNVRRNDKRSDLYFVGCMLYQLVAGVSPLMETRERMKRLSPSRYLDVEPVYVHVPDIPHRCAVLIGRLMELEVEKRIQTPGQALRQTEAVIAAIKGGDTAQFDAELSEQEAREYDEKRRDQNEGGNRTILIIESNVKLQDLLRERLKTLGYRVLITSDLNRGMARFDNLDPAEESPVDCVMFGCVGLGTPAIDAFGQFAESKNLDRIPAIVIVPENMKKLVKPEWLNSNRLQFSTPVKLKDLRSSLRKLMNIDEPSQPDRKKEVSPVVVNDPKFDTDVEADDE